MHMAHAYGHMAPYGCLRPLQLIKVLVLPAENCLLQVLQVSRLNANAFMASTWCVVDFT